MAAMVAMGTPITAVCIWVRWSSQQYGWDYVAPGRGWEFCLPYRAP